MPFLHHRGFEQHHTLRGQGSPLVWAHGLYMSADKDEAFFGFFDALAAQHRLLTFDARGHGRSSATSSAHDYTFDALAADLDGLIEAVELRQSSDGAGIQQPLALVGGSMGGMTALTYAFHHPERVRRLVLFQPTCVGDDVVSVGRIARMLLRTIERQGMRKAAELFVSLGPWAELARHEPERVAQLQASFEQQNIEGIRAASEGVTTRDGFNPERLEQLRSLQLPVLLIADPSDPSHPLHSAEQLAAVLPQARLVVAPHNFYYFEHRTLLLDHILSFLASVP
ncbi:MAG: alpha/beta fold hydrolase [Myxococcota bacterium]